MNEETDTPSDYHIHDLLCTNIIGHILHLKAEIKKLHDVIDNMEASERRCLDLLFPIVGWNEKLHYSLRLPNAVEELVNRHNRLSSNVKVRLRRR